jgi:hypothetical protein
MNDWQLMENEQRVVTDTEGGPEVGNNIPEGLALMDITQTVSQPPPTPGLSKRLMRRKISTKADVGMRWMRWMSVSAL